MGTFTVGRASFSLPALESIRVVASCLGYYEVDCEPTGNGYKVTARKEGVTVGVRGDSWNDCLEKFLVKHDLT